MNIGLLTQIPPPIGGIAIWSLKYIDYCKKNNINLQIVNTALIGERAQNIHAKRNILNELKRTFNIIINLRKMVKNNSIDIIHFNTTCSCRGVLRDYLCFLSIPKRIPIFLQCHCTIDEQLGKNIISEIFFKLMVKKSKKILVLNTKSMEFIKNKCKKDAIKVENFVGEEYLIKEEKNIQKVIKKAIFLGHVNVAKGINEIIEAALQLPSIEFIIAGAISKEYEKITLPKNVKMIGNKNNIEVMKLLDQSDIFVFPSYTEGFSLAVIEAMARGLPCIVTDVGTNSELIEKDGGIIIPIKDSKKLVEAIESLQDKNKRSRISRRNIETIKKNFTTNICMDKMFSIYNDKL